MNEVRRTLINNLADGMWQWACHIRAPEQSINAVGKRTIIRCSGKIWTATAAAAAAAAAATNQ